jgi:hypothetical protein
MDIHFSERSASEAVISDEGEASSSNAPHIEEASNVLKKKR